MLVDKLVNYENIKFILNHVLKLQDDLSQLAFEKKKLKLIFITTFKLIRN